MTSIEHSARDRSLRHALVVTSGALAVSLCIVALCVPILQRSPWADEVMLFSNYPLASLWQALEPLPNYDQAATPLYSIAATQAAPYGVEVVRGGSLAVIVFAIAFVLIAPNRTWLAIGAAGLCLTALLEPLVMFSEFKHYGLEAAGVATTTAWFEYKESRERFGIGDAMVLAFGMVLGISTLITAGLALGLFFAVKFCMRLPVKAGELALGVAVVGCAVGYYLLINHITQFQMANYTDAYATAIGPANVVTLFDAVLGVVGRQGLALTTLAALATALTASDPRSRRLLLVAFVTGAAVAAVSFLGLYPATNSRHLNWTAAIVVALLFAGVHRGLRSRGAARIAAVVLSVSLIGVGVRTGTHLWRDSFEVTQNGEAMAYLAAQPPSPVGLWVAGQPLVDYYAQFMPAVRKHSYFGLVNRASAVASPPSMRRSLTGGQFASLRDQPGAWGRTLMLRATLDYTAPAAALVAEAPRGTRFFILASHYDVQAKGGYPQARVDGLKAALTAAHCDFRIVKGLRRVVLYQASCP